MTFLYYEGNLTEWLFNFLTSSIAFNVQTNRKFMLQLFSIGVSL